MNYMPEVLKMLGLEVGEKFNIKGFNLNPYQFDEEYNLIDMEFYEKNRLVQDLLIGRIKIEKLPWKPKYGEKYYFIGFDGLIDSWNWTGVMIDHYCYNAMNIFRTSEEITDEIKQRILQEMKGKYEND